MLANWAFGFTLQFWKIVNLPELSFRAGGVRVGIENFRAFQKPPQYYTMYDKLERSCRVMSIRVRPLSTLSI
jgi:hypothetical protein